MTRKHPLPHAARREAARVGQSESCMFGIGLAIRLGADGAPSRPGSESLAHAVVIPGWQPELSPSFFCLSPEPRVARTSPPSLSEL